MYKPHHSAALRTFSTKTVNQVLNAMYKNILECIGLVSQTALVCELVGMTQCVRLAH